VVPPGPAPRRPPALLAGLEEADEVLPLFVLDDVLRGTSGAPRLAFLYRCLREVEDRTDGRLRVVDGRPEEVLPRVAREVAATGVHISSDHAPYGRARDERVRAALGDVPLVATGSPYGVTPGTLVKADGTPFKVYSPYARAWQARGLHSPASTPATSPGPTAGSGPTGAGRPRPRQRRAARGR
jgi:deoxyribodipyrimidine photo-lyase